MRIKSSYHVHSNFCDGKNTLEEMAEAAVLKNFTHLGFSSHAPVPQNRDAAMDINSFESYKKQVLQLKEKYKNKLNIFLSLEYDCYEDIGMVQEVQVGELDYYIMSIHSLGVGKNKRAIDYTDDEFAELIKLGGGDYKDVVKRYYNLLLRESLKNKPDIIGHIDIIKKNNINSKYFNEKENWYLDVVNNYLKEIKKIGCVVEVNTGGVARYGVHCLYPSDEILHMIKDYEIPLMLNSDAHAKENLDFYYDEAIKKIKNTGINKLYYLTYDGWDDYKI